MPKKNQKISTVKVLSTILAPTIFMCVFILTGSLNTDNFQASVLPANRYAMMRTDTKPVAEELVIEEAAAMPINCAYDKPEETVYDAKLVEIRKDFRLAPDKPFMTKVYMENTGNVPWFSDQAACGNAFRLGTTREKDRNSIFYSQAIADEEVGIRKTGWLKPNRIAMTTPRVDPGEIAEFVFESKAPHAEDVYIEFFAPVVEGKDWLNKAEFPIAMHVGDFKENTEELELKVLYLAESMKTSEADFKGGKNIEVDISDQRMMLKIGSYIIDQFTISSGEPRKHPTPRGNYEILFKQSVRIGAAEPHYIMPYWQAWRWDGYGLHSLPSVGSKALRDKISSYGPDEEVPVELYYGDSLWNEANDHIGRPVSHGCIRMLHEDSAKVYEFTEAQAETGKGTPLFIHD